MTTTPTRPRQRASAGERADAARRAATRAVLYGPPESHAAALAAYRDAQARYEASAEGRRDAARIAAWREQQNEREG